MVSSDALFGLAGVAVGWLLGEGTGLIKTVRRTKLLRRALLAELADIAAWLERGRFTQKRCLMLFLHGQVPIDIPSHISAHIYGAHFVEVAARMPRDARLSYTEIHGLVSTINALHDEFRHNHRDHTREGRQQDLAGMIEAAYCNSCRASYFIKVHLQFGDAIRMSVFDDADAPKLDKQIKDSLIELREKAKTMTLQQVQDLPW